MAEELTADQAIEKLRALPEDRQRAVLARLDPEVKKSILTKLQTPEHQTLGDQYSARRKAGQMQKVDVWGPAIGRGAALGFFEGLGLTPAATTGEMFKGSAAQFGQGLNELIRRSWERLGRGVPDNPVDRAAALYPRISLMPFEMIYQFMDQTATSIEQGIQATHRAIQQKDYEAAAENLTSMATQIALLRESKKAAESKGFRVPESAHTLLRRLTESEQEVKAGTKTAIESQTEALAKNRAAREATIRENLEKTRSAETDIAREKQAIAEKNRAIEAQNRAQAEQVARRKDLEKTVDRQSAALGDEVGKVEQKVALEADRKFEALKSKIGQQELPSDALVAAVKDIQQNVLQGIPESVKEFNSILKLEGASEELTRLREDVMTGQGMTGVSYEELSPERKRIVDDLVETYGGQVPETKPLTWDYLQALKSRLQARLRKRSTPPIMKRAYGAGLDAVMDEMGKMAQNANAVADWQEARDFWRGWREDFHEPTGPSGSGSPIAQVLDAVDPKNVRAAFLRTKSAIGNRAVETLRKYGAYGGNLAANAAEEMLRNHEDTLALPKKETPKPAKPTPEVHEMPTRKAAPAIPEAPTLDVTQISRDAIERTARRIGRLNAWDARIVASSLIAGALAPFLGIRGGVEMGAMYVATKYILANALEKPKIVEWIAKTPQKELDVLNKLPGAEKIKIQAGITELARQTRAPSMSAQLRKFLGKDRVATIPSLVSASQGKRKAADQIKQLRDISDQHRSSNPLMPTGEVQ